MFDNERVSTAEREMRNESNTLGFEESGKKINGGDIEEFWRGIKIGEKRRDFSEGGKDIEEKKRDFDNA